MRQSYFGHDEFAADAPGMKTLTDASTIRRRIYGAFEMARRRRPAERRPWLTFALVGGGPTGVELAARSMRSRPSRCGTEFQKIDPTKTRVLLFDGDAVPWPRSASLGPGPNALTGMAVWSGT